MIESVAINTDYEVRNYRKQSIPERHLAAAVIHRASLDLFLCKKGSDEWKQAARFFESKENHKGTFEWYCESANILSDAIRDFLFKNPLPDPDKYKILVRAYSKLRRHSREKEYA